VVIMVSRAVGDDRRGCGGGPDVSTRRIRGRPTAAANRTTNYITCCRYLKSEHNSNKDNIPVLYIM